MIEDICFENQIFISNKQRKFFSSFIRLEFLISDLEYKRYSSNIDVFGDQSSLKKWFP